MVTALTDVSGNNLTSILTNFALSVTASEWEPNDAVWMGWQEDTTEFYFPVVADIIKSIAPHVNVKIAFDSDSLRQKAKLLN